MPGTKMGLKKLSRVNKNHCLLKEPASDVIVKKNF